MAVTDEILKGLAAQAANMAKTELRYRHEFNGLVAVYFEGSTLHRMRSIEKLAKEKAGPDWLNSGEAKDIVFGVLRAGATAIQPGAIVICTAADQYEPTPAFLALPDTEKDHILDPKGKHPRDLPEYFQPHDALVSIAQNAERVCICRQKLQGSLLIGQPEFILVPQENLAADSRLKMFRAEVDPRIAESLKRMQKERLQ